MIPPTRVLRAALPSVLWFYCAVESTAFASTTSLDGLYERDTLGVYRARSELSWLSDEIGRHLLRVAAHSTTTGAGEIKGIGGGMRSYAGADVTWIVGLSPVELRLLGGIENFADVDSWRADGKLTLAPKSLSGFATTLFGSSHWLDSWFAYGIRSNSLTGTVNYAGVNNWAEVGGVWDERSSPRQPQTTQQLDLRSNRIKTVYAWYTHGFTDWLMAGFSTKWVDSAIDYHQPVSTDSTTSILRYSDYPYPTPHSEGTWAALLELRAGPVKLKGTLPFYSQGSYRVEAPYVVSPYTYYSARWMAQSELHASLDASLSRHWGLTLDAFAFSRPYRSGAWFTNDAWNQFGLNVTLRYKTQEN